MHKGTDGLKKNRTKQQVLREVFRFFLERKRDLKVDYANMAMYYTAKYHDFYGCI